MDEIHWTEVKATFKTNGSLKKNFVAGANGLEILEL